MYLVNLQWYNITEHMKFCNFSNMIYCFPCCYCYKNIYPSQNKSIFLKQCLKFWIHDEFFNSGFNDLLNIAVDQRSFNINVVFIIFFIWLKFWINCKIFSYFKNRTCNRKPTFELFCRVITPWAGETWFIINPFHWHKILIISSTWLSCMKIDKTEQMIWYLHLK